MKFLINIFSIVILFTGTAFAADDHWDNMTWDNGHWYVGAGGVTGAITVNIAGHNLISVANAHVILEGTDFYADTDLNGHFMIENVPEGIYDMVITAPDFEPVIMEVLVSQGQVSFLDNLGMVLQQCQIITDVNGNNKIDLADIVYGLQVLAGQQEVIQQCQALMDVNGNNEIDLADIIFGLQVVTGE